jgi:hypothetical protein
MMQYRCISVFKRNTHADIPVRMSVLVINASALI